MAAEKANMLQKCVLPQRVVSYFGSEDLTGKRFAIWGLAFKPRTDDTREAPALTVCKELLERGATLSCYDPEAMETFAERFGEHEGLTYAPSNYEALEGADALIVCTEWNEFRNPNFERVKELLGSAVVFDGRNIFSRREMESNGFHYMPIGRPAVK